MIFEADFRKSLKRDFYTRATENVARDLIGKVLVKKTGKLKYLAAAIIETEAYLSSGDPASHSWPGKTNRNAPMFENGGILYVYTIYGVHRCINFVTGKEGEGCAVLIRAGLPLAGIDVMKHNRDRENEKILLKGPGNFTKALAFGLEDNYNSLCTQDLFVQDWESIDKSLLMKSPRIGITRASDKLLRFYINGSPYVSGKRNGVVCNKH